MKQLQHNQATRTQSLSQFVHELRVASVDKHHEIPSILAKVERDRMVREWDPVFPVYGLASNKGYSTPRHLAALRQHGPSPLHRQSFAPVWNNPVPQEVLAFMLEEKPEEVLEEMKEAAG